MVDLSPGDFIKLGAFRRLVSPWAPTLLTNLDSALLQNRVLALQKLSHKGSEFDIVLSLSTRHAFYIWIAITPNCTFFRDFADDPFSILRFVFGLIGTTYIRAASLIIRFLLELRRSLLVDLLLSRTLPCLFLSAPAQ